MSTFKVDILQSRSGGATTFTNQWAAKAWVNFNGTGTIAINKSANITSITDNGVGDYTPTFTNSMTDIYYTINGTTSQNNGSNGYCLLGQKTYDVAPTTSAVRVYVVYCAANSAQDCNYVNVMILGN